MSWRLSMSVFSASRRLALRLGAAAAFAAALAACGESAPAFKGSDISGTQLGRGMELSDFNGKTRQLSDFAGKVVVVFFGFTQCPDVCPTSLAELGEGPALALWLDGVGNPHNFGAILRSAAHFGAKALLLVASDTPSLFPSVVPALSIAQTLAAMLVAHSGKESLREIANSEAQLQRFGVYADKP